MGGSSVLPVGPDLHPLVRGTVLQNIPDILDKNFVCVTHLRSERRQAAFCAPFLHLNGARVLFPSIADMGPQINPWGHLPKDDGNIFRVLYGIRIVKL